MSIKSIFQVAAPAITAAAVAVLAAAPAPARADDALTVISGSIPTAFFEVLGDVAQYAGFYKAEHLDVTVQYAGSPSAAAQLVVTGKGDIASLAIEPLFQGYDKGLRLQAFFSRDPRNQFVLAVLDDSPIKTLADFKGATLGELTVGNPAEYSTNATLTGAGLKRTDYSYVPIGSATQGFAAIAARKVSAAAFPYTALANYEAFGHVKFRFFWNPIVKDIPDTAYAATPAVLASKADALRRFTRASTEAAILIRENPALAALYYLQGAGIKITPESLDDETRLLELSQNDLPGVDPLSKTIGAMPLRDIGVYAQFLTDQGVTSQTVPAAAVVTDQFIPYANDFDHGALVRQVKTLR
jgi:NitT/TauT family transport system substrate-binding protein